MMHLGEMGNYQKFLVFWMLPFGIFFAFTQFSQMFITATPQRHWCWVPELAHLTKNARRNLTAPGNSNQWNPCRMYDVDWTDVLQTMEPPDPSTKTVPCKNGWEYELTDIPYHTIVSERGWVCGSSQYVPLTTAIFFFGASFGGVFFGWLADRFGRLSAFVGANMLACLAGATTIFTKHLWDFALCRFLVGLTHDNCYMLLYILVLEYVGPHYRTCVTNISISIFYGVGCVSLPWIAYAVADWQKFILVTTLPLLLVTLSPYLLPESTRWLTSRGKTSEAVQMLKTFERVNKSRIPPKLLEQYMTLSNRVQEKRYESFTTMMKSRPLRRSFLFMCACFMGCSIMFDGLLRISENLGLDFFVTFSLLAATEIPASAILMLVLDRWGRRKCGAGALFAAGGFTFAAAFVSKGLIQVILALIARFFVNMSFSTMIQWTAEILPTVVRASCSSVVHVSGFIASMLSPFIVYSEHAWTPLPLLILSLLGFLSSAIAIYLPETMGMPMPQTIADGEKLISENSLFRNGGNIIKTIFASRLVKTIENTEDIHDNKIDILINVGDAFVKRKKNKKVEKQKKVNASIESQTNTEKKEFKEKVKFDKKDEDETSENKEIELKVHQLDGDKPESIESNEENGNIQKIGAHTTEEITDNTIEAIDEIKRKLNYEIVKDDMSKTKGDNITETEKQQQYTTEMTVYDKIAITQDNKSNGNGNDTKEGTKEDRIEKKDTTEDNTIMKKRDNNQDIVEVNKKGKGEDGANEKIESNTIQRVYEDKKGRIDETMQTEEGDKEKFKNDIIERNADKILERKNDDEIKIKRDDESEKEGNTIQNTNYGQQRMENGTEEDDKKEKIVDFKIENNIDDKKKTEEKNDNEVKIKGDSESLTNESDTERDNTTQRNYGDRKEKIGNETKEIKQNDNKHRMEYDKFERKVDEASMGKHDYEVKKKGDNDIKRKWSDTEEDHTTQRDNRNEKIGNETKQIKEDDKNDRMEDDKARKVDGMSIEENYDSEGKSGDKTEGHKTDKKEDDIDDKTKRK